jgi:uncharacterized protein (TIGR03083 family)
VSRTPRTRLTTARHAEWLLAQTDQLAGLVEGVDGVDLGRPVPTCPDWNLRQLVEHIGRGHRAGLDLIRDGVTGPVSADPGSIPVPGDDELPGWLRDGARDLVDTVASAGPERPVWNYLGVDLHAGFWVRRMAHDTAVHRFDASLVVGRPLSRGAGAGAEPVADPAAGLGADPAAERDVDLAADGVSEWLMVVTSPGAAALKPDVGVAIRGTGQTLHLHATDGAGLGDSGGWIIRRDPGGASWRHGHGRADVEVHGRAFDLLLALLGRIGLTDDRLGISGDRSLIEHWVRHVVF